ncbi:N-6 DNA methylase [Arthrobacter sp. efr-133-TYG-118]|uniref:HsdM family class I SAM-dependent methyltransferase n=1 Tax=Arthrobacter sp. efr-133-TYG-118 TaxID=3040279 RepID=UPI00254C7E2B|nr:N-6 DNA methylase [Arthrobacter sp. efr-133-TYG-118]
MKAHHPAVQAALDLLKDTKVEGDLYNTQTTSLSLARALAIGSLSRLDPSLRSIDIWDPAVGSGFAGFMLTAALESTGVHVRFRGQDISEAAVAASRRRFEAVTDAELAVGNTLAHDQFGDFEADLVIVDAPWGMNWTSSAAAVAARQESGAFGFGIPQRTDSTWLFISLALEKLRPIAEGGGRVAALVNPGALSAGGESAAVRQKIVGAGLLESVTRLPEGLAPNTSTPLYLLTFTNKVREVDQGKAKIADLQAQFTTERGHRSMPVSAFSELEFGLRTGKPGPRNRSISVRQFIRREARLSRLTSEGRQLSWRLTTYNDTAIDDHLLESRYGPDSGVSVDEASREIMDLNPGHIFGDDSRELLKDMDAKGWPCVRLSSLLTREPEATKDGVAGGPEGQIFIPTTRAGKVSAELSDTESRGRLLAIQLNSELVQPSFLTAWLNSEEGVLSRRRAIEASSSGMHLKALRSDSNSLMRWADELIIPAPDHSTQLAIASADEQLGSFQAELSSQRAGIWAAPESAEEVVHRIAQAFDDSLDSWLDQLPFPIASALWTAATASSPGEQQRAYLHAWEAIVTFHATVLLSASRSDPGSSSEVEAAIRRTLQEQHLGIERASFGTWVVIIEKTSKDFRRALETENADEIARVRRAFGDLTSTGIERLISKDVVQKFKELNFKRNRWLGHSGYTSDDDWRAQVVSLVSDLRDLRLLLGNVWAQLLLVRAGSAKRGHNGIVQSAEVAVGTRSPFASRDFNVGDVMLDGELYLARDGSQSPLRLGQFVQLRAAPSSAQYTSYFYNRTEGSSIRMVSYQYGPESELSDKVDSFRDDFGALVLG